ncbi:hypothetical protein MRB53_007468 [Persea americana]|uniref:Uncharacterized protein n=1 Tax=Persea americana TaxID=3435 RepID=A0ACC2MJA3_PERAE|nr:hypothetical protein MRB53_007468 [Persea americana]
MNILNQALRMGTSEHVIYVLLNSDFKAKIAKFSAARPTTDVMFLKLDVYAFGVVWLELPFGREVLEVIDDGQREMLWKEMREIVECVENKRGDIEKMDGSELGSSYPIDDALGLAATARACMWEVPFGKPGMGGVVFSLSVLAQSYVELLGRG